MSRVTAKRVARCAGVMLAAIAQATIGAAFAQSPASAPAVSPSTDLALEAVQAAMATCNAMGFKVAAGVFDAAVHPVALLTANGAMPISPDAATRKAFVTLYTKQSSGAAAERVKGDRVFERELTATGKALPVKGALPILVGGEVIGAISVAGAPRPGDIDEQCARAGLDKIASRLTASSPPPPAANAAKMTEATKITEAVVLRHMDYVLRNDMDGLLKDMGDPITILGPNGPRIFSHAEFYETFAPSFANEPRVFKVTRTAFGGNMGIVISTDNPGTPQEYQFAETFYVEQGKIVAYSRVNFLPCPEGACKRNPPPAKQPLPAKK